MMSLRTRFTKRCLGLLFMAFALAAFAAITSTTGFVDDPAIFQLDGDAQAALPASGGSPLYSGDDWDTVNSGGGSSAIVARTGVVADFGANDQIFKTGSSKDIAGINPTKGGWKWAILSGPPDKDDLTNAYAVAYDVQNSASGQEELWAYFGTDRFDNSGDALLGFWFFQDNNIGPVAGGSFAGHHTDGDILVLASFTGGGTTPTINLRKWSCSGATSGTNCDDIGTLTDLGSAQEKCNPSNPSFFACAITNTGGQTAPWTYHNKSAVTPANPDGTATTFPAQTFFEGGINLTHFGVSGCISKFQAETRSSTDLTKSVNKDFVLGNFNTCNISVTKSCGTASLINSGQNLQYPVSITISSSGFGAGTVHVTSVVDTATLHHFDGSANTAFAIPPNHFDLFVGDTNGGGDITVPFDFTGSTTINKHFTAPDGTSALSNSVHVEATIGGTPKTADFTGAQCTTPTPPGPTASKVCTTIEPKIVPSGNTNVVASQVQVYGTVCNPAAGDQFDNVTLTDNQAGALTFTVNGQHVSSVTLPPNTCKSSDAKNYLPSACDPGSGPQTTAGACAFTDTVTAGGTDHVTGQPLPSTGPNAVTGSDTCHYCPNGFCSTGK